jgi:acetylornithine deacetylase/succinyl-diaminopimelate desuccinylase-like protein
MAKPGNVIETLQAMVRIDSVNSTLSGKPKAETLLCDWLEKMAKGFGLSTQRLPLQGRADQLLVTHVVDADAPWLLFDSHMDTVAVDGMTVEPFGGELRAGRVYGRGTCDTKGTGAAMLWAMKQYAQDGKGPNNIALFFGVDEEVGMHGVLSFLKQDYPGLGFVPSGVIVGEPTELMPIIAHNGVIRWQVTTHGVASHSSVPHDGRSAISMMMKLVHAIESDYIPTVTAEHKLTGRAACSVNMIRGGSAPNIIPDQCVIDVDRRVVPGEDYEAILPAFIEVLDRARAEDPTIKCGFEVGTTHAPLLPAGGEGLLSAIKDVLGRLGLPTLAVGAPFATHASHYSNAGLPAVVLGPGEIDQAHTCDEYISTDQLERGVDVYRALMQHPIG